MSVYERLKLTPPDGPLAANLTTEQGKNAARAAAIDLMSTLQAAAGDLNQIKRILARE